MEGCNQCAVLKITDERRLGELLNLYRIAGDHLAKIDQLYRQHETLRKRLTGVLPGLPEPDADGRVPFAEVMAIVGETLQG